MEAALVVVTLTSLATAAAAVATACRVVRGERQRSAARVAALAAALGEGPEAQPAALFEIAERPGDSPRRLGLAFAAGALIVTITAGSVIAIGRSGANREAAVRQVIETSAAADHPLELMALRHGRDAGTLTIAGVVRNPTAGRQVSGLTAVVAMLDRSGLLISRRDVPLDYRTLAPGEESPFRVTLPDAGTIGRYRVSFRTNGAATAHVDRRGEMAMATQAF